MDISAIEQQKENIQVCIYINLSSNESNFSHVHLLLCDIFSHEKLDET